jgi:periplasmic protein TonB
MFVESLLESNGLPPTRRGWTTLVSFGFQAVALMALVAVPVLFPEALRLQARMPNPPMLFTPIIPERVHVEQGSGNQQTTGPSFADTNVLQQPPRIPRGISRVSDDGLQAPPTCLTNCPTGPAGPNVLAEVVNRGPGPAVRVEPSKLQRVSSMQVGAPIRRVQPIYPRIAILSRKEGAVILTAIISREGNVESLQVISGSPMLTQAALDAVKQWRYRPYVLNGERIEVETQITVIFKLGQ